MEVQFSQENPAWPALWRLALELGLKPRLTTESLHCPAVSVLLLRFFCHTLPWQWLRIFPILYGYLRCQFYLQNVAQQAAAVRNCHNRQLVEQILQHCRASLAQAQPADWGELAGLSIQKLLHLAYYQEMTENMVP